MWFSHWSISRKQWSFIQGNLSIYKVTWVRRRLEAQIWKPCAIFPQMLLAPSVSTVQLAAKWKRYTSYYDIFTFSNTFSETVHKYTQILLWFPSNIFAYLLCTIFQWGQFLPPASLVLHGLFISRDQFQIFSVSSLPFIRTRMKESIRQLTFCPDRPTEAQLTKAYQRKTICTKGWLDPSKHAHMCSKSIQIFIST